MTKEPRRVPAVRSVTDRAVPAKPARVMAAQVMAARVMAARVMAAQVMAARVMAARLMAARAMAVRAMAVWVIAVAAGSGPAGATEWAPTVSERLIRLPAAYLDRAIERDFERSDLAVAMREKQRLIDERAVAVEELGLAADRSTDAATAREARHQALLAKQSYVTLMGERLELRRKRLDTKVRLLKALSRKLERRSLSGRAAAAAVSQERERAVARFEAARRTVDARLLEAGLAPDSRYASAYDRNLRAIQQLAASIASHPANVEDGADLDDVSTEEHVRRRLAETEIARALLDQEEKVLGYMAKLVSLDALAFAEEVDTATATVDAEAAPADLAAAAALFIRD